MILLMVLFLHVSFLSYQGLPKLDLVFFKDDQTILNIRRVKTPPIKNSLTNVNLPIRDVKTPSSAQKGQMSFKDLAVLKNFETPRIPRPGSAPVAGLRKENTLRQISMQDNSFKDFAKSYPAGIADPAALDTGAFKISDATIGIDNPDGVEPDELNQNELVYYGFQKRMLVKYIQAIVKELGKFQQKHRHFQLEPNSRIWMTARLTYDSEGNVKQIKMIRWSNLNAIQDVFEGSMKSLDKLSNPPKDLWTKNGEFNVFYSWVITNNG